MSGYMFYWKPFRSKYSLYSSLAAEITFGCCVLILFVFVSPRSDQLSTVIGWFMICLVVISLLTSWICVALQQLRIFTRRRERLAQKAAEKQQHAIEKEAKTDAVAVRPTKERNTPWQNEVRGLLKKGTKRVLTRRRVAVGATAKEDMTFGPDARRVTKV